MGADPVEGVLSVTPNARDPRLTTAPRAWAPKTAPGPATLKHQEPEQAYVQTLVLTFFFLRSTSQRQLETLAATAMALSQQVQMLLEDKV